MKKSLSLSLFCLMGISTLAYGGWTKYVLGDGKMAKGDCLEMLCPHGCVEDDKGNVNCCSEGKLGDKCWGELCCQEGLFCSSSTGEGKCVECVKDEDCAGELVCNSDNTCTCPAGIVSYIKVDGTKGCCSDSTSVISDIEGSEGKTCCPKEVPKWNALLGECVALCPEHSSKTITSWKIGTTGCYCELGYIPNEAGTECKKGCYSNADCENGKVCGSDNKCYPLSTSCWDYWIAIDGKYQVSFIYGRASHKTCACGYQIELPNGDTPFVTGTTNSIIEMLPAGTHVYGSCGGSGCRSTCNIIKIDD